MENSRPFDFLWCAKMDSEIFNCSGGLYICTIAHYGICTFAHSLSEDGQMCKTHQFLCKKCAKTIKRYLEFGAVFFFPTLKEGLCSFRISFFGFRRELHSWIEQRKSQNPYCVIPLASPATWTETEGHGRTSLDSLCTGEFARITRRKHV